MFITRRKLAELLEKERNRIWREQDRASTNQRIFERLEKLENGLWECNSKIDNHINKGKKKTQCPLKIK